MGTGRPSSMLVTVPGAHPCEVTQLVEGRTSTSCPQGSNGIFREKSWGLQAKLGFTVWPGISPFISLASAATLHTGENDSAPSQCPRG